jgi:hypothetical protein
MRSDGSGSGGAERDIQVAAIYFPSWHAEPRRDARRGPGWTEWELMKAGRPRFPGHAQPIEPAWGYAEETDPAVMTRSVATAAEYGIDAFLWDWYWYDGEDFLNRPLNETYLSLPAHPTKFALMWANHNWMDVFPARNDRRSELVFPASVNADEFHRMTDLIIERYLTHPAYWRVNGAAWFTIFMLQQLQDDLGGVAATAAALADFRARARAAGAGELHINAMGGRWSGPNATPPRELGIDCLGPYNWLHQLMRLRQGLTVNYRAWRLAAAAEWPIQDARAEVPYIPNVTMGWDSTTRVSQDDELTVEGWPRLPVVINNTPAEFGQAVADAVAFLERRGEPKVLTINAWNEWTEGSYLEPDRTHGLAYLEALARALGRTRTLS